MKRLSESAVQALLLQHTLDTLQHAIAAPNITNVFSWECDLLSVTKVGLAHEWEIKRSTADYNADFKKYKHYVFSQSDPTWFRFPNYFWFVTEFPIEPKPPPYAGWLWLDRKATYPYQFTVKQKPLRLHSSKMTQKNLFDIGRVTAYRLKKLYLQKYT